MTSLHRKLVALGVALTAIGATILFTMSLNPDSALAGYALATYLGGLTITGVTIADHEIKRK
ncbi:MAG: hypothetical protein Q4D87_08875 [Actinomycetaceae bacterium]|nr:hypothetical protein [Actinomycetaceae bacterium]